MTASSSAAPSSQHAALQRSDTLWWSVGLGLLSVRFIQGFVYWGGGSRRFIYAPAKLDPDAHSWMAHKFQTAMPGALLGMEHVISYMLQHFWLLYAGVIAFSAAELVVGILLMVGLMTRAAAAVSMVFSVLLMLMFGWQGATCIDEWTMAACNLAMGATLLFTGAGSYSLDARLLQRRVHLGQKRWFRVLSGALPIELPPVRLRTLGLALFAFVALFDIATYNHYRGSVYSPFHAGPVSPTKHHLTITMAGIDAQGQVRFHVYLDAGTPEAPVHVVAARMLDAARHPIATWNAARLSAMPRSDFANDYAYNRFAPGAYGITAPMGAKATITLPAPSSGSVRGGAYLELTDVDGRTFGAALSR